MKTSIKNTPANQYFSNIPATDADYYQSIANSFDDSTPPLAEFKVSIPVNQAPTAICQVPIERITRDELERRQAADKLEQIKNLFPEFSTTELKNAEQLLKPVKYTPPDLKTAEQVELEYKLELIKKLFPEFSAAELKNIEQNLKPVENTLALFSIPKIDNLFNPQPKPTSEPHYPAKNYLTAEQASAQIQELSDHYFKNLDSHVAIKASAGSGKTRAVVDSLSIVNTLAKTKLEGQVHVFVPDHKLANEWFGNLQQIAPHLNVLHLFGRGGNEKTNISPLCQRYEQVKQVQDHKMPIFATMCKQGDDVCPFFEQCQYIKQFNQNNDVVILPHSYLSLNHSAMESKPAAVVIDERFFTELISDHHYLINHINDFEVLKEFRFSLLAAIAKVKENNIGLFSALKQVTHSNTAELISLLTEILAELGKIHNPRDTRGLKPNSGELFFKDCLSKVKNIHSEIALITTLLKELEQFPEREESSFFRIKEDYFYLITRYTDNRFNYYLDNNIPILMIDADCNELIINELLKSRKENELEPLLPFSFNEINVKRKAKVFHYINSKHAKSRFFPHGNKAEPDFKRVEIAAKTIKKLSKNKRTLVVTYKDLEPMLRELLPEHIAFEHFGAIRGIDAYKNYDIVIVLGRNEPPAFDMENIAAALFCNDAKPILFTGCYEKQERQYRTVDGKIISKPTYVHKDERVQAVLEQFRECEALQSIDRLRFIHGTDTEREIHILTDTVLDIDVDFIEDSTEILPKGRTALAEILELNNGILPLSPTLLLSCYSDKFVNIQQVKNDLKRVNSVYSNLSIHLLPSMTYRLSGQTKGKNLTAMFQSHLNPLEVINRLQELHGEPIQVIRFNEPESKPVIEQTERIEVKPTFKRLEGVKVTLKEQNQAPPSLPSGFVVLPYTLTTEVKTDKGLVYESGVAIGYEGSESSCFCD